MQTELHKMGQQKDIMLIKNFQRIVLLLILFLMVGCSSYRRLPSGKYWHAGSERPYIIRGVKYYPQINYKYDRVGYASWYGYDCHGKSTATGRIFSKNKLTAAHRTLPLPCVVLVENLENHRRIKLVVNDRGPFVDTKRRIIDVTQRAAQLLGFRKKGMAKVRVTCLPAESRRVARQYKRKPY